MSLPSEGHLRGHRVEPRAVLGRKLTQVVAISGDDRVDEAVPLGLGQRGEIGFTDALEIFAAGWPPTLMASLSFGVGSIMPFLPWQMSWQARAAEALAACVPPLVRDPEDRVEPAKAARFPVADGAEAGVGLAHGSNL